MGGGSSSGSFGASCPAPGADGAVSGPDLALIRYVRAAVARPADARALRHLASAVVAVVGPGGLEVINAVVAFSGALNTVMDIMGVVLEPAAQRFAAVALPSQVDPSLPWVPRPHHFNPSPDAALGAESETPSQGRVSPFHSSWSPPPGMAVPLMRPPPVPLGGGTFPRPGPAAWLSRPASNMANLLRTLPAAASGMSLERRLYAGIPSSASGLRRWVDARLGTKAAPFLRRVGGIELARAWCFGLRENLTVGLGEPVGSRWTLPGCRRWSDLERAAFVYAFAAATGSAPLADAAVVMATHVAGQPAAAVADTFAAFAAGGELGRRGGGREDLAAARRLVAASAAGMDTVRGALVEEVTRVCSPPAVLELASILSFAEMWRRMEVLFGEAAEVELGR